MGMQGILSSNLREIEPVNDPKCSFLTLDSFGSQAGPP